MKKKIQKPFNVEAAKKGAKVETRDDMPARIICYDRVGGLYPIIALVDNDGYEVCNGYDPEGKLFCSEPSEHDLVIVEEIEVPKFNINDWIVGYNEDAPRLIIAVTPDCYEIQDLQGNMADIPHRTIDNLCRIWTLKDAKPGDVLVNILNFPFIYKGTTLFTGFPTAYCGFSEEGDFMVINGDDIAVADECVKPATKAQRDRLFREIKKAGYKWEAESLTLSEIPKRWTDDKEAPISGYFIEGESSRIVPVACGKGNHEENYNVFATEMLAKSALAMARISQIMANDIRFGGPITDAEWCALHFKKFVIKRIAGRVVGDTVGLAYNFLAFHTEEQRQLFLEENERLIKDYFMIE